MKLNYIINTLLVEYATFRIYNDVYSYVLLPLKFLFKLMESILHIKSLGMQYSVITASEGCMPEIPK